MRTLFRTTLFTSALCLALGAAQAQTAAPSPSGAAKGYPSAAAHETAAARGAPGQLVSEPGSEYLANEEARCSPLNGADRQACLERVRGQNTTQSGSVQGGGILRETVTTVPVAAPPAPAFVPPAQPTYKVIEKAGRTKVHPADQSPIKKAKRTHKHHKKHHHQHRHHAAPVAAPAAPAQPQ